MYDGDDLDYVCLVRYVVLVVDVVQAKAQVLLEEVRRPQGQQLRIRRQHRAGSLADVLDVRDVLSQPWNIRLCNGRVYGNGRLEWGN